MSEAEKLLTIDQILNRLCDLFEAGKAARLQPAKEWHRLCVELINLAMATSKTATHLASIIDGERAELEGDKARLYTWRNQDFRAAFQAEAQRQKDKKEKLKEQRRREEAEEEAEEDAAWERVWAEKKKARRRQQ
jgi:hypothetical protein